MAVFLIAVMLIIVAGDQIFKYWIDHSFAVGESRDFISLGSHKIFDLTYVRNDGAVFGSMSGQRWFLIGFTSLIIVIGLFILFRHPKHSKLLTTSLVLFISGGIGNLIDRIRFGYVVDMFDFQLFDFAVFNIADICVVIGIFLLVFYVIFIDGKIEQKKKSGDGAAKE